jgi:hypothetical protein
MAMPCGGDIGSVRHIRYSSRIGKPHRRWDGAAFEQYRSTQSRCLWRCLEATFDNDAFGVIGAEAGMDTKYLVHRVDELLLDRLILSPADPGPS